MEDTSFFATALLPLALAVIMMSLGLSLVPADFLRIFRYPKGVSIGLANLLVVSPFLAFGVASLFALEPALAVGLVLLGASPGGTMANLLTHLARGDTALSVSMTALSSIASVITVPLYLGLAIDFYGADFSSDPEMIGVAAKIFFITVIPLSIGMLIRRRFTQWTIGVEQRAKRFALGVFVFVVVGSVIAESEAVTDHFVQLAFAALLLNVAAMTISFNVARLARLSRQQATAIAMELGIHNGTVAITVGAGIATILASPAAVYSTFMFITAGIFARMMYRRNMADQPVLAGAAAQGPAVAPDAAEAPAATAPLTPGSVTSAPDAEAVRAAPERVPSQRHSRGVAAAAWAGLALLAGLLAIASAAIVALALAGVEIM